MIGRKLKSRHKAAQLDALPNGAKADSLYCLFFRRGTAAGIPRFSLGKRSRPLDFSVEMAALCDADQVIKGHREHGFLNSFFARWG